MSKSKKNTQQTKVKENLGKPILYVGLGDFRQDCHFCGTKFSKQIVSEYKGKLYCNEDCIKMEAKLDEKR